ncbi:hypothetical protein HDU99_009257 [Rhizoclosmatium hyalinum]|nr:hypothetical protein HDU99_009257 [Rhizoclosmatium hyalinum]
MATRSRVSSFSAASPSLRGKEGAETDSYGAVLQGLLQRVPGLTLVLAVPFVLFVPSYSPGLFSFYYAFLNVVLVLTVARATAGVWSAWRVSRVNLMDLVSKSGPSETVFHWIIIPNYKEELETLRDTLEALASQPAAKLTYKICLAMEEGEVDSDKKAATLIREFPNSFAHIHFTIHPKNLPNEQRGKSSNVSWAATQIGTLIQATNTTTNTIITIQDTDTHLTADYFATLTNTHLASPETAHLNFYTPYNIFDRNSNTIPAIVRIMDIYWTVAQLSFFPSNYPTCVPLSTYSIPFLLAHRVGWDVNALAEDYHMCLELTFATNGAVRFQRVYSPASQCNIVGKGTFATDFKAKRVQLKRHHWGGLLEFSYVFSEVLPRVVGASAGTPVLEAEFLYPNGRRWGDAIRAWIKMWFTVYHTLENAIWPVHAFLVNILAVFVVPGYGPAFLGPVAWGWWKLLNGETGVVAPVVSGLTTWIVYVQLLVVPIIALTAIGYEGLYTWCSFGRWEYVKGLELETGRVGLLGKRSAISNEERRRWVDMFDWLWLPVVVLYSVCQIAWSSLMQIGSSRLDYVVAAKPVRKVENVTVVTSEGIEMVDRKEEPRSSTA